MSLVDIVVFLVRPLEPRAPRVSQRNDKKLFMEPP